MPDSARPLQLKNMKPSTTRFDERAFESYNSRVNKKDKEVMKTWHHVPIYHNIDSSNNKSSLFIQPSNAYQRHFSIHPEWGLHTKVKPVK